MSTLQEIALALGTGILALVVVAGSIAFMMSGVWQKWSPSRSGGRSSSSGKYSQYFRSGAAVLFLLAIFWFGGTVAELLHGALSQIPNLWIPSESWLQTIIMAGAVLGIVGVLWAQFVPVAARKFGWEYLVVIIGVLGLLLWALPQWERIEAEQAYEANCPEQEKLHLWSGETSGERLLCAGGQNNITVSNTTPAYMTLTALTITFVGGESIPASEFDARRLRDMCYFNVPFRWEGVSSSNCAIKAHQNGHFHAYFGVNRDSARAAGIESISFRAEYVFP